jgi:hypothetical protein
MDMRYFTIFDMATVGIPAITFCIWQLVSVNREIARDKLAKDLAAKAARDQSPKDAGHAIGEHRLDDR